MSVLAATAAGRVTGQGWVTIRWSRFPRTDCIAIQTGGETQGHLGQYLAITETSLVMVIAGRLELEGRTINSFMSGLALLTC